MVAANKYLYDTAVHQLKLGPGTICLGRAKDNDIKLADNSVSPYHARIFTYFNTTYIEDLDSANGTFLNGKKIYKHIIHPGDVIRLGLLDIKITDKDEWPYRFR